MIVVGLLLGAVALIVGAKPAENASLAAGAPAVRLLQAGDEVWVTPEDGGVLQTANGRIQVLVPPGAVAQPTLIRYRTDVDDVEQTENVLAMFALEAEDGQGQAVHEFALPLELTYMFEPGTFPSEMAEWLALAYWDEGAALWLALPTAVDKVAETLQAEVVHFSVFGVLLEPDATEDGEIGGVLAPSVLGAAPSEATGDLSYAYALDLPAGAGGLKPGLGLIYSSGEANGGRQQAHETGVDHHAQAGDVGYGWSLSGANRITKGNDGRRFLHLNGSTYKLKHIEGDQWETEPASFLRIVHDDSGQNTGKEWHVVGYCEGGLIHSKAKEVAVGTRPWHVWTPDGRKYQFGSDVGTENEQVGVPTDTGATATHWGAKDPPPPGCSIPDEASGDSRRYLKAHAWNLVWMRDTTGNEVRYNNESEEVSTVCPTDFGSGNSKECRDILKGDGNNDPKYVRSTRPVTVTWGFVNGEAQSRAVLAYESGRSDYNSDWNNESYRDLRHQVQYTKYLLTEVRVQRCVGTGWETIRTYELLHGVNGDKYHVNAYGVDGQGSSGDVDTNRLQLTGINLLSKGDGGQALLGDSGLAATTMFDYFVANERDVYLSRIRDVYKGDVQFRWMEIDTQEVDGTGRSAGGVDRRYVVAWRDAYMGVGTQAQKQRSSYDYFSTLDSGETGGVGLAYHPDDDKKYQYLGFNRTVTKHYDVAPGSEEGTLLKQSETAFWQVVEAEDGTEGAPHADSHPHPAKGRPKRTKVLDDTGRVWQKTEYDYELLALEKENDIWSDWQQYQYQSQDDIVWARERKRSEKVLVDPTGEPSNDILELRTETETLYDRFWQNYCTGGGPERGTGTHTIIRDKNGAILKSSLQGYCPNDDGEVYIINKPMLVHTSGPGVEQPEEDENYPEDYWANTRATRYIYGDASSTLNENSDLGWKQTVDEKGLLRAVRTSVYLLENNTDWENNLRFVETQYEYDGFGNPDKTKQGLAEGDKSSWASSYRTIETVTYDPTYHSFPTSSSNALNQESATRYYGVNGQAVGAGDDGSFFGQVEEAFGPNGEDTKTSWQYDIWGRMVAEIRPGDSETSPSRRYEYVLPVHDDLTVPYAVWQRQKAQCNDENNNPYSCDLVSGQFYDGLGQLIQSQSSSEDSGYRIFVDRQFDGLGRLRQESVPHQRAVSSEDYLSPVSQPSTSYEYDDLGRTTQVTHTDGNTSIRTFYKVGESDTGEPRLLTAVLDEKNHQTISRTDVLGRLRRTDQYDGEYPDQPDWGEANIYAQSWYEYDALDNLTLARAPRENSVPITMTYDALGRKTGMTDPDMGHWEYKYDAVGNLTRQTDAGEEVLCFYYDGLNRLAGKKYDIGVAEECPDVPSPQDSAFYDQVDVWYKYDQDWDFGLGYGTNYGTGRRTGMKNEHNKTQWVYDKRGRMLAEFRQFDQSAPGVWDTVYTTHWTYDPTDRVQTMTYPDGEVVEHGYNEQGLLTRVDGDKPYVDSTTYDAAGRIEDRVMKNNSQSWTTIYTYHPWDEPGLGRLHTSGITGTQKEEEIVVHDHVWQNLTYDYDAVGNIETITDTLVSQTQAFNYDELDRLIDASAGGTDGDYTANYQYYKGGGIKQKELSTNSPAVWDYGYTDADHIHAVTHINDVERYRYDDNGNMNWRNVDGVEYGLTYNPENRLESVTDQSNGEVTRYTYDGDGNRVIMKVEREGMVEVTHYVGKIYERSFPATEIETAGAQNLGQMALSFVENIGQTANPAVEYQSHAFGSNFFFTRLGVVLVMPDPDDPEGAPAMAIAATFEGASPWRHIASLGAATGGVNYFRGDDPDGWHTGAPTYAGIAYQDLYPGIWLEYNGSWRAVKAAYHVAPGADPGLIRWRYSGVTDVQIDPATGDLLVTPMTWGGDGQEMVIAHAPTAWQEIDGQRIDVAVSFALLWAGRVGFSLGAYDPTYELIIDPTMDYSGVFGGSVDGKDYAYDVAVDDAGNVYLTGETYSAQFPDGSGQYTNSGSDAFVMKLVWNEGETDPSEIITTYLGGSDDDAGLAIAIDDTGHIYVTGRSESSDFPLVNNLAENDIGFVTKLASDVATQVYSTKLPDTTVVRDIAVNESGDVFLTGGHTIENDWLSSTNSLNQQAPESVAWTIPELVVAKLSWDGVNLSWEDYARTQYRHGFDLSLAKDGTLYVATQAVYGLDGALNYLDTTEITNSIRNVVSTDSDIMVFDSSGVLIGTYDSVLEDGERLWPMALMLDGGGHLFATGVCDDEGSWKTCVAAYQTSDMSLLDSAYLGGDGDEYSLALDTDGIGQVYITGYTDSTDFPQVFPTSAGGGEGDIFIARYYFDGEELTLNYSSLLGGTDTDVGTGIAVDDNGHAYVAGYTYSGDYPTTPDDPPAENTNGDVILSRITFTPSTKYYYANGQLVAFERADYPENNGRRYVFRDHLGSTSIIVNGQGERLWEDRFYPFGDVRYTYRKDDDPTFPAQTDYRYTGQRLDAGVGATATANGLDRGLYFYNSRYYDASLARFLQPDTIVPEPGNPQSLNRYSYVLNNALRYTDPTGHAICMSDDCVIRVHPKTGQPMGIRQKWGIIMVGPWEADNAWMVAEGMNTMAERVGDELGSQGGGDTWVSKMLGGTQFVRWPNDKPFTYDDSDNRLYFQVHPAITAYQIYHQTTGAPAGVAFPKLGNLFTEPSIHFFDDMWEGTPVHEVGHIIDYSSRSASTRMGQTVSPNSSLTEYGKTDRLEDFAESWRLWVYDPNRLGSTAAGEYRLGFISRLVVDLGGMQ